MKPDYYSKRLLLIIVVGAILMMFAGLLFSKKEPSPVPIQPEPKEQVFKTTFTIPTASPNVLLASDMMTPGVDWGEMTKNGIGSMVMLAVFLFVVSPLVRQSIESNNKLTDALNNLNTTIATGNTTIINRIVETERNMVDRVEELMRHQLQELMSAIKSR